MGLLFPNWPFSEDEVVTLHWIASPKVYSNGSKYCDVFFRTARGDIQPIPIPWGCLPALQIGDIYANGKHIRESFPRNEISISTNNIYKGHFCFATEIPPQLYELKVRSIFDEYCYSFEHNWYTYYIPCVEVARVFLANNSVLADRLISSGGLEDLIDLSSWSRDGKQVTFDFRKDVSGISENLAKMFAVIYGTPQLLNAWKNTYAQFVATGFIKTILPTCADVNLSFIAPECSRDRFVYSVELRSIHPLLAEVHYGPETLVHAGHSTEKSGVIIRNLPSKNRDLELTGSLAKRTQFTAEIAPSWCSFLSRMKASRKRMKDPSVSKTRIIEPEDAENAFSVGDISSVGKKAAISLEMRDVHIASDADFASFCAAIEMLGKYPETSILDVSFADLPQGKRVSLLHMPPKRRRKYACVLLQKGLDTWLIIELCNKDGCSISTLFTKCPEKKKSLSTESLTS